MIVLDTNVLSELMRPIPSFVVSAWVMRQATDSLFTTVISQAELSAGIALLPDGMRKRQMRQLIDDLLSIGLRGRVLSFEATAVRAFADISASRRRTGKPIATMDAMIAAITATHGAILATRDRDFAECGIPLVDPWTT